MFGSYRKGDANDPEIYVAAIAAILSEYPESVIDYATDPRTGLPSSSKFLPNPAEVRAFCEAQMAPLRAAEARRKQVMHQLEERLDVRSTQDPAERERIVEGFKTLSEHLGRNGITNPRRS